MRHAGPASGICRIGPRSARPGPVRPLAAPPGPRRRRQQGGGRADQQPDGDHIAEEGHSEHCDDQWGGEQKGREAAGFPALDQPEQRHRGHYGRNRAGIDQAGPYQDAGRLGLLHQMRLGDEGGGQQHRRGDQRAAALHLQRGGRLQPAHQHRAEGPEHAGHQAHQHRGHVARRSRIEPHEGAPAKARAMPPRAARGAISPRISRENRAASGIHSCRETLNRLRLWARWKPV